MNSLTKNWASIQQQLSQHRRKLDGEYLRLRDQEETKVAFAEGVAISKKHWIGRRPVNCEGKGCQYCDDYGEDTVTANVLQNVFTLTDEELKIFEGPPAVISELVKLSKDHDPSEWAFTVRRDGTGFDTRYSVRPYKKLTLEQKEKVANLELYDLDAEAGNDSPETADASEDEAPEDEASVTEDPLD